MDLAPALYRDIVRRALEEDVREGDITTEATVAPALMARGVFLAKADCVIAGLDIAFEAFRQVAETDKAPSPVFAGAKQDGDTCRAGDEIAGVVGFQDPFHFSKVFRKRIGISPRQFRDSRTGGTRGTTPERAAK